MKQANVALRAAAVESKKKPPSAASREMLRKHWAPFVTGSSLAVRVSIVLFCFALCGACVWKSKDLSLGLKIADVFPDDSYVTEFIGARSFYFEKAVFGSNLVTRGPGFNFEESATQAETAALLLALTGSKYVTEAPTSWLSSYLGSSSHNATDFYGGLNTFLSSDQGKQFIGDVNWKVHGVSIDSSRFGYRHPGWVGKAKNYREQELLVTDLRQITQASKLYVDVLRTPPQPRCV